MGEEIKIIDLPIPSVLKEFYIRDKITSLYPPQADVVNKGLFDNKNLLISIPTASGKTLMAEMAMLTSIIDHHGKALYIVPLKALASEKYDRFCKFEELGQFDGKKITTAQSTGDFKSKGETLAESDIIVVTSEKADSLIRNKAPWIESISIVIIDEIHLVGDRDRGATLEMVIAKLRRLNPKLIFIGLSATIGNPEQLAAWLKAELIVSEWRPTQLKEGVFYNNEIQFENMSRPITVQTKDNIDALVMDMVLEGGQCLVFCTSRKSAESKAKSIAKKLYPLLDTNSKLKLESVSAKISDFADKNDSKSATVMANNVSCGAAYHHAGLIDDLRQIIESEFRTGLIKVIFCTPTLAAGVNLPARRVIIPGYKRFNQTVGDMDYIRVMEYKQMAGRAGRPHLDPYGECVLVPSGKNIEAEVDRVVEQYIHGNPEEIYSGLAQIKHLRIHILSSIASEFVDTVPEFNKLLHETFLAYLPDDGDKVKSQEFVDRLVQDALKYLIKEHMVIMDTNGAISSTQLGKIVSRLCLNPTTAALIVNGFKEIENTGIIATDITLLHLLSLSEDIDKARHYKSSDTDKIPQVFHAHEKELVKFEDLIKSKQIDYLETSIDVIEPVKIADIIRMWINESKEAAIAEFWSIGEGDVHSIVEQSKRVMSAIYDIGMLYNNEHIIKLAQVLRVRINKGIKTELIGLTKVKGIGRARARLLYTVGITTPQEYEEINKADPEKIRAILYPKKAKVSDTVPTTEPAHVITAPIKSSTLPNGQKSFADY
jgi:helicase